MNVVISLILIMELNILTSSKSTEYFIKKIIYEINALDKLTSTVLAHTQESAKKHFSNKVKFNTLSSKAKEFQTSRVGLDVRLYNGVQIFINVVVQYINSLQDYNSSLPSIIRIPEYLSLSSACSVLWKSVCRLCDRSYNTIEKTTVNTLDKCDEMVSRSTQTVNSCITYCASCHTSTKLVRTLVNAIIREQRQYCVKESHVSRLRDHLGIEVMEMSQWGVMNKWVGAVIKDFTWAMSIIHNTQKRCSKLYKTKTTMEDEHRKAMTAVEDKLIVTQTQLDTEKSTVISLKHKVEELRKSLKRQSAEIKVFVQQMNRYEQAFKHLNDLKNSIKQLNETHRTLGVFIKSKLDLEARHILSLKSNLTSSLDSLQQYFKSTLNVERIKQAELCYKVEESETIMKQNMSLNQEKETLTRQIQELKLSVYMEKEMCQKEVNTINSKLIELEKDNEEIRARELLLASKLGSLNQQSINSDPLKDMENQRQQNKHKIKALLKENASLKMTIVKIKKIKPAAAS